MNSKGHLVVSVIKSAVRIIGCIISIAIKDWTIIPIFLIVAEVGGVAEELFDKR